MRPSHNHALNALMKLLIVMILVVLLFNPAVSWQAALAFLAITAFFIGLIIITYENFEQGMRKQLAKKEDDALLGITEKKAKPKELKAPESDNKEDNKEVKT